MSNLTKFVFCVLCVALPLGVFAQTVPFSVNLHYGSQGADVISLQEFLTQQGVYSGPISGNFYSLTLAAVRNFQSLEGITPVSGYVGPITRGVINQIISSQSLDDEGNAVIAQPPKDLSNQTQSTSPTPLSIGIATLQSAPATPQDCTPQLQVSVVKIDGSIDTGIDYMFYGTSTLPVGCAATPTATSLQTPTVKYTGDTAFGSGNTIYVLKQGWGIGRGIQPTGVFIWTVGNVSTTTVPVDSL